MSNPSALAHRLNEKLYRLALICAAAFFALSSFRPVMDNVDLGWHIAQGRWMIEHGAVYRQDWLNYPTRGRPLVDEYPLFQVVLYLAWKLGWWGPCLLTAAAYVGMVGILARAARTFGLDGSALFTVMLATTILYLQLAFPLRPHLATFLALTALGVFLLRHHAARNWTEFWPMALLQIAWTNCHSAFVLGPAMVALFGLEMSVREGLRLRALPWPVIRVWAGAFLLILLACFVNPFGLARFWPPFQQDRLEVIRAFVSEMEPLQHAAEQLYENISMAAALIVLFAILRRRGAVAWSFLALAGLFYLQSLSVQKSWPVFGLFLPLIVLSTSALGGGDAAGKHAVWLDLPVNFIVTAFLGMLLIMRLDGSSPNSLQSLWRAYDLGRRETSGDAVLWMQAHGLQGRLLHRCEDGGWLQQEGYDHGETFGDTGFGKYDEAFIRTVSLLSERPALLPFYLRTYQPAYVVCNNFCYLWPYHLRAAGWRLIFYTPYGNVWTQPGTRPDLPTVSDGQIEAAFAHDLAANGRPTDLVLLGRNLIALNSLGLQDFAYAQLTGLPADLHHAPWYWEAARILCFEPPAFSALHRHQLLVEANGLPDKALTAEFRAYAHEADGDAGGARLILETAPQDQLRSHGTDLLLQLELADHDPKALAVATRTEGFDLRDGRHWALVAKAQAQAGHEAAAAADWTKAVYYYPDDAALMQEAAQFAVRSQDADLRQYLEENAPLIVPGHN